jgi:hypothetical protein
MRINCQVAIRACDNGFIVTPFNTFERGETSEPLVFSTYASLESFLKNHFEFRNSNVPVDSIDNEVSA